MAQLKAGEVERYINKPSFQAAVHLIYGPDHGLVHERATKLAAQTSVDLHDPFATIKLDPDNLSGDPDRLINEAYTVSMFGGARLIWLRGAGNDAALVKQTERLLEDPPENTFCIFQAGELKKGAKLRDLIERSKNGLAIPCYSDGPRDIAAVLEHALKENGQTIGMDARQFLMSLLGADRVASRAEIDKLCLYTRGQNEISVQDIQDILGDTSIVSLDAITDAVMTGNVDKFDKSIAKFNASGGSYHQLFAALLRQFQTLDRLRGDMEQNGKNAGAVIGSARPPIFFARKASFETALNRWSCKAIRAAHNRLQTAMLESRKNNKIDHSIAHMAMLGLTVQASRQR